MTRYQLPTGEKWRQYELRGLALRDFAGLRLDSPLDPFALARFANLLVVDFEQIRGLSEETRQHLLGAGAGQWSGGACSRALPDGTKIIILNPQHGARRLRATLMEEICHVFLGHTPNRLAVVVSNQTGRSAARDYQQADEEEAYGVGAAALVPFSSLRRLLLENRNAADIARHFYVSRQLVEYRLKVTHLWSLYRSAHAKSG